MEYQTWVNVDDDEIIDYVSKYMKPDEVFSDEDLRIWALDNGFIEEE